MELEAAKKRCEAVIESIVRLQSKLTPNAKRTLLSLAHSDLSFLSRSSSSTPLSVNIGHIEAVAHILHHPDVTAVTRVCKPLPIPNHSSQPVHVDIICNLNTKPVWIVVSDRNPTYISWQTDNNKTKGLQTRVKQLVDAAVSADAAALRPASVMLFFANGLGEELCDKLAREFGACWVKLCGLGLEVVEEGDDWVNVVAARSYKDAAVFEIKVRGDVNDDTSILGCDDVGVTSVAAADWDLVDDTTMICKPFCEVVSGMQVLDVDEMGKARRGECDVVNFDTTALIALVSSICNGGTEKLLATPESELRERFKGNYEFVIGQVMSEIQNPILVGLGSAVSGKRGIICETVHLEFKELMSMYGGPNEKLRASHLLKYLRVVPDSPSKRMMSLPTTRKLALKCKVVFGTGDYWCAPTATANMAFVRAVSQAGMSLCIIEHGPRALTGDLFNNIRYEGETYIG